MNVRNISKYICFNILEIPLKIKYLLLFINNHNYRRIINENEKYVLFITHNLGGGVEQYVKNNSNKDNVLILRNVTKRYSDLLFILENKHLHKKVFITYRTLKKLLLSFSEISIMSVSGYADPFRILILLSNLPEKVKVSFYLHDFYCICPSTNLLIDSTFCKEECYKYMCVFGTRKRFYGKQVAWTEWQKIWGNFLKRCNLIIVFSKSSERLFLLKYPFCKNIEMKPHTMEYFKHSPIQLVNPGFKIGIFGKITSETKGVSIVHSFLEFSKNQPYEVSIIGSFPEDKKIISKNISYSGLYLPDDLPEIINKQKISVIFFPSPCPETFSYTVSEFIILDMPIACFNIGAQAEKIASYHKGCIIPDYSNEAIEKSLFNLYGKFY